MLEGVSSSEEEAGQESDPAEAHQSYLLLSIEHYVPAPSFIQQFLNIIGFKSQSAKKEELPSKVRAQEVSEEKDEEKEQPKLDRDEAYFAGVFHLVSQRGPTNEEVRKECWNAQGQRVAPQFAARQKEFDRNFKASQERLKKAQDLQAVADAEALVTLARVTAKSKSKS